MVRHKNMTIDQLRLAIQFMLFSVWKLILACWEVDFGMLGKLLGCGMKNR